MNCLIFSVVLSSRFFIIWILLFRVLLEILPINELIFFCWFWEKTRNKQLVIHIRARNLWSHPFPVSYLFNYYFVFYRCLPIFLNSRLITFLVIIYDNILIGLSWDIEQYWKFVLIKKNKNSHVPSLSLTLFCCYLWNQVVVKNFDNYRYIYSKQKSVSFVEHINDTFYYEVIESYILLWW